MIEKVEYSKFSCKSPLSVLLNFVAGARNGLQCREPPTCCYSCYPCHQWTLKYISHQSLIFSSCLGCLLVQGILVLVSGPQSKNAVGVHHITKKPRTWFKIQKRLRRYKCLSIVALSNLLSVGRWFLYYETEVKSLSVQADKVWWLTGEAIMDVYGWAFGMNLTDLMDSLDYEGTRLPPASNPGITRSQLMWIPPFQLPRLCSTPPLLLWEPAEVSWESWGSLGRGDWAVWF